MSAARDSGKLIGQGHIKLFMSATSDGGSQGGKCLDKT